MIEKVTFRVDDVGIAEQHSRKVFAIACFSCEHNVFESIVFGQTVACIEEHYIIALCFVERFIHGEIYSIIGLAGYFNFVSIIVFVRQFLLVFGYPERVVDAPSMIRCSMCG